MKAVRILGLVVVLPVVALLLPLILLWSIWETWRIRSLRRALRKKHDRQIRGILVYSNSPNWQSYIEEVWLPRVAGKLVVLNWSERHTWGKDVHTETALFRRLGQREFNPAAIVFKERSAANAFAAWLRAIGSLDVVGVIAPHTAELELIRFFRAFRDYKHGKGQALIDAEQQLFDSIERDRATSSD
jgi:hypothetical protein